MQVVVVVTFRSIAHAELDAEIDSKANEQDRKSHRNQVERPHHRQPERHRNGEADQQTDEDGRDDPPRPQREPQDGQHDQDGPCRIDEGAFLHGREFFIGNRHRAGEPQLGVKLGFEVQVGCRLADGIGRRLSGRQRGEIENRAEFDEPASLARRRRPAVEHRLPGKARPPTGDDLVERIGDHVHRARQVVERVVLHPRADQAVVQRRGEAAEVRILRQRLDDGLRLAELAGGLDDLLGRQEQQPVAAEERPAAEFGDRAEKLGIARQLLDQGRGRLGSELGGRGVNDRQDGFFLRREGPVECRFTLAPGQVLRDQLVDIGVDGKMTSRVNPAAEG